MTRSRVVSRTLLLLFITRDTVIGETPAWRATSWIVTASPLRRSVRVAFFTRMDRIIAHATRRWKRIRPACYRYHRIGNVGGAGVGARRAVCLVVVLWVAGLAAAPVASAEDGYDLWLRYRPVEQPWADRYRTALTQVVAGSESPTLRVAHAELQRGLRGLLGVTLADAASVSQDGALVIGTQRSLPMLAG